MKNKFLELQSTVGEIPFHAIMNPREILYIKRTGATLGVAFIDRPGELLFDYKSGNDAKSVLKLVRRQLRVTPCHNDDD